jgi:putative transposase
VLDYMVTSNHVHLVVKDTDSDVIANSMQLIAGRTESNRGQVFNLALLGLVDASIHR